MKKLLALVMALSMALTLLAGCGSTPAPAPEAVPEPSGQPESQPEPEPAPSTVEGTVKEVSDRRLVVTLADGTDFVLDISNTAGAEDVLPTDTVRATYTGAVGSAVATGVEVIAEGPDREKIARAKAAADFFEQAELLVADLETPAFLYTLSPGEDPVWTFYGWNEEGKLKPLGIFDWTIVPGYEESVAAMDAGEDIDPDLVTAAIVVLFNDLRGLETPEVLGHRGLDLVPDGDTAGTASAPASQAAAPPPVPEPVPESPAAEPVPEPDPEPEPKQAEPPADALAQIVNTTQRRYPVIYLDGLEDACDQVLELKDVVEADPFTQLAACYDFLVAKMNSGSRPGIDYTMSDEDILFLLDLDDYESQQAEYFCAVGFSDWEGDCVVYAGMFYTMAKHIGFDARMIMGNTPAAGGGKTMHKWVEIDFGGQTYVFDANLGANFAKKGLIADPRVFFATTYGAHPGRFLDREVYPRSPVYRE